MNFLLEELHAPWWSLEHPFIAAAPRGRAVQGPVLFGQEARNARGDEGGGKESSQRNRRTSLEAKTRRVTNRGSRRVTSLCPRSDSSAVPSMRIHAQASKPASSISARKQRKKNRCVPPADVRPPRGFERAEPTGK